MFSVIIQFDCACLLPLDLFYLVNMKVNPWLRLPRLLKVSKRYQMGYILLLNLQASMIVREPVIGLIKWLRPKGLKVCSYVEK